MAARVSILATGSSGNCYYISDGKTSLLLDAGIPVHEIEAGLSRIGVAPESIDAVLLSHSHSDHAKGLRTFINRYQPTAFLTQGTADVLKSQIKPTCGVFKQLIPETLTAIGTMHVLPMRVPHDDPEPVGFALLAGGSRCAFVADVGEISPSMTSVIRDVDFLFLESNHDIQSLQENDNLPDRLRLRIGLHHLANSQVQEFVRDGMAPHVRFLLLGHLSRANNSPTTVHAETQTALGAKGFQTQLSVLPAGSCSELLVV